MLKLVRKPERNKPMGDPYLFTDENYLGFSMDPTDKKIHITSGTAEGFKPYDARYEFRVIEFNIPSGTEDLEDLSDEELDKLREIDPLNYIIRRLYANIKDTMVFSDNRIRHGRNFIQIIKNYDESFTICVCIDLVPDLYSENQFNLEIAHDPNSKVYKSFSEFYQMLGETADKQEVSTSLLTSLFRLISLVGSTVVNINPLRARHKSKTKKLGSYPDNNQKAA